MRQVRNVPLHADLLELQTILENEWPEQLAALRASGVPVGLYDDLDDDALKAKAKELGVTFADDADRDTITTAVKAAEDKLQPPPWGDDENFDPQRAWKLIQDTRADRDRLKTEAVDLRTKVKEHDDASKTEQELAAERAATAETTAANATREAARLRVALSKGLTETQAKRLVGETQEELEADADELLASFVQENDDDTGQDPPRRPRERMRPGAAPGSQPEETDPAKLAALVPRRY
jgi:hypothetical protein